jgi:hypothetical protein
LNRLAERIGYTTIGKFTTGTMIALLNENITRLRERRMIRKDYVVAIFDQEPCVKYPIYRKVSGLS